MVECTSREWSESELREAFAEDRFVLHYQPQVSSREGHLVGVEGLVRLRSSTGDFISPQHFVNVLETTDLIHDVGRRLFEHGCAAAAGWPGLQVAINVSPRQFEDAALAAQLIAIAQSAGVSPGAIDIEITEGVFFRDPDRAEIALRALRDAGFHIALDDFGTGYSSLAYLLRFPVSKIKIDQSFVRQVPGDVRSATIVHAIVALGRSLGLKIVGEGVETEEQRVFLRVAGCHVLQGYLFAGALGPDEIDSLRAAGRIAPGVPLAG